MSSSQAREFNFSESCMCSENYETCPLCSVKFLLNVENKGKEALNVTTRDLILTDVNGANQKLVKPVQQFLRRGDALQPRDLLLAVLGQNQRLHLECVVKKGKGGQLAKWSPAAVCVMRYEPLVRLDETVLQRTSQ